MRHDITDNFRSILDDAEKLFEGDSPFEEHERIQARNRFRTWRTRLDEPCRVAVVGMVNSGKSTFINAMMGQDWAKVDANTATGTICAMTNHEAPNPIKPVLCHYKDTTRHPVWITLQEAHNLQSITEEALIQASDIEYLEFAMGKTASPMLMDFELVDTPGIGAIVGEDSEVHDRITYRFLEKADALILLIKGYTHEEDIPLLKRFCETCHKELNKADSAIFIVASQVDSNSGDTMNDLILKKEEREFNILHSVMKADMPASTKVIGISALLENVLRQMGEGRFIDLHQQVRSGNTEVLQDFRTAEGKKLKPHMRELLRKSILQEENPTLLAERLRYLSGVEEAKKHILREMRIRKTVLRIERLWKEVKTYLEWDLNRLAARRQEALRREQAAFGRFCRMVEQDREFSSGKLGAALKEFMSNFRNDSYAAFEQQRKGLVTRLQNIGKDLEHLQKLADVYNRFYAERDHFTTEEAEEITRLCGMGGTAFSTTAEEARNRDAYWRYKAQNDILSADLFTDIASVYAQWWTSLIQEQ